MKITLDSHISISCTVGKAAVAGAVAGAVGVATFGLGTAVLGTGAAATVASGAVSGVAAGQASIVMENILTGQEVTAGLGEPGDIAQDAFVGATLAGVGRSIDIVRMRARYSGYYSRYISEGELQAIKRTGLLRGGRSGETYFTTDHFVTAKESTSRLALPDVPRYRIDFQIVNHPRLSGPQRVQPWIWPLRPGFRAGFGVEYWTADPVKIRLLEIKILE